MSIYTIGLLFAHTDIAISAYYIILLKGSIRIYKTSLDGKESTIKIINQDEIFAESILFWKKQYPATATAVEMSEIIAIYRDSFWKMMDNAGSRDIFLGAVFEKLRFLTDQIHYLSSCEVEDRFFKFIINTYGKKISL